MNETETRAEHIDPALKAADHLHEQQETPPRDSAAITGKIDVRGLTSSQLPAEAAT